MTAARPRGSVRPDVVYLGWRQLPGQPEPGPPPVRPATASERTSQAVLPAPVWLEAQRREYRRRTRTARVLVAVGLVLAAAAAVSRALVAVGRGPADGLLTATAVGCLALGSWLIRGGRRALAHAVQAERERLRDLAAAGADWHAAGLRDYARQHRDWQRRSIASAREARWFPVTVPDSLHRVDVAGGTLAGWSALLTMLAAPRLAVGGAVTVLDLTEGGVAADLIAVARQAGLSPRVLVLPADLPRLDLGAGLDAGAFADVLARTAAALTGQVVSPAEVTMDAAILGRVLDALGDDVPARRLPGLVAGLRVLGQAGSPADQLGAAELSRDQLSRLHRLAGHGAAGLLARAIALHASLRALAPLATAPAGQPSPLSVAWLDRRAPAAVGDVLAAYLPVALTADLRQAPPGRRWQHTVVVLAAERLPGDVLDRLCTAAEIAGPGLVLCFRGIPAHVGERLGRGNAAVAFMRLGNAEDAKAAADQIGARHRFVVSQLTDTVGASVADTVGVTYTSSEGFADSAGGSLAVTATTGRSRSRGRAERGPFAALTGSVSQDASRSAALSDTRSITTGITSGTSWGWSTSRAIGANGSLARTAQRARESVVEPHELQKLPQSAILLSSLSAGHREVVLADANPAIMALPAATLAAPPLAR